MRRPFGPAGRRSGRCSPRSPTAAGSPWPLVARFLATLLLVAAVALPTAVLHRAAVLHHHFSDQRMLRNHSVQASLPGGDELSDTIDPHSEELGLEKILEEASMEDKTVILTTLNAAWAGPDSVFDLFIESFRVGNGTRKLLDNLVIIALDPKAYARCVLIHTHCFALTVAGVDFSGEKHFMSAGYLDMMWRRVDFLRTILEMGFNFIFTDVDILWFRNPLTYFYPDGDFQIACDHFLGNATDLGNRANGGFNYVKSNNRSIEFYKFWYASRERYPGYHDQDVFNFIKHDPFIAEIGLQIRFLSTTFFGGLCEPSKDLNKVCTMHANCCIGLHSKLHDLKVMLEDWREFMSLPPSAKLTRLFSWRVPQNCSLSSLQY